MSRLVSHCPKKNIRPFIPTEPPPPLSELIQMGAGYLDGGETLQYERSSNSPMKAGLIVRELNIGPDAAGEQPLVPVDKFRIDMHEVKAARGESGPVLPSLILFIEAHRA
jgi:hypothetical protein